MEFHHILLKTPGYISRKKEKDLQGLRDYLEHVGHVLGSLGSKSAFREVEHFDAIQVFGCVAHHLAALIANVGFAKTHCFEAFVVCQCLWMDWIYVCTWKRDPDRKTFQRTLAMVSIYPSCNGNPSSFNTLRFLLLETQLAIAWTKLLNMKRV